MIDLATWIAERRAASEGATEGPWVAYEEPTGDGWLIRRPDRRWPLAGCYMQRIGEDEGANARHIAAFDPATTRRLLDAVEALAVIMAQDNSENPAGADERIAAWRSAEAALDALRGGDHG